jgi:hypothetical protein
VFHHVTLEDLGIGHDGGNIELRLQVYDGDIRYKLQHVHPALKIYPPFATAHAGEQGDGGYELVEQCHADYGDWYVTMTALSGCSAYNVQYFLHSVDRPCTESAHEPPLVETKQDLKGAKSNNAVRCVKRRMRKPRNRYVRSGSLRVEAKSEEWCSSPWLHTWRRET